MTAFHPCFCQKLPTALSVKVSVIRHSHEHVDALEACIMSFNFFCLSVLGLYHLTSIAGVKNDMARKWGLSLLYSDLP